MEVSNNQNNPDLSFLEQEGQSKIHIKDILFLVLRNLHWLILFAAIGAVVGNINARRQVRLYESNAKIIIKNNDATNHVIDFRSSVRIYSHQKDGSKLTKNIVYYNFKLQCRDGRYRYTITDFNEKATAAAPIERWLNPEDKKWDPECFVNLQEVDEQIKALISSLVDGMQPAVEKTDEW